MYSNSKFLSFINLKIVNDERNNSTLLSHVPCVPYDPFLVLLNPFPRVLTGLGSSPAPPKPQDA